MKKETSRAMYVQEKCRDNKILLPSLHTYPLPTGLKGEAQSQVKLPYRCRSKGSLTLREAAKINYEFISSLASTASS
jgi:hypothetical protein